MLHLFFTALYNQNFFDSRQTTASPKGSEDDYEEDNSQVVLAAVNLQVLNVNSELADLALLVDLQVRVNGRRLTVLKHYTAAPPA